MREYREGRIRRDSNQSGKAKPDFTYWEMFERWEGNLRALDERERERAERFRPAGAED